MRLSFSLWRLRLGLPDHRLHLAAGAGGGRGHRGARAAQAMHLPEGRQLPHHRLRDALPVPAHPDHGVSEHEI